MLLKNKTWAKVYRRRPQTAMSGLRLLHASPATPESFFSHDMIVSGIKASPAVTDENATAEVVTAVTGTPLRKVGGGGFVSPATAFNSQVKLISSVSHDDVPNLVPSVIPIHRAAPVLQSGAKNKKKAAPGAKDSSQADEEGDEAEVPAVRRKTVTLPAASVRSGGGTGKSRKKSKQVQPSSEMTSLQANTVS